jgi:hypothetical protein
MMALLIVAFVSDRGIDHPHRGEYRSVIGNALSGFDQGHRQKTLGCNQHQLALCLMLSSAPMGLGSWTAAYCDIGK